MVELSDPFTVEPKEKPELGAAKQEESQYAMVLRLLKMAKQHRSLWDKDWNYNYSFVFAGRQWGANRPKSRFSECVNVTWGGIMQETGIETDTQPQTDFNAEEPSDIDFANILKEINDRNWQKYNWEQKFTEAKLEAKVIHVIHTEVKWNPELEGGLGDIEHVNLDPFYFYWDPQATCIEDARYVIYAKPTPTRELRLMYPDADIKADIESINSLQFSGISSPTEDMGYVGGISSTGLEKESSGGEELTQWIRIWIRDDAVEEVENTLSNGSKEYVLKKKYPNGRYMECINGQVVQDGGPGVRIGKEWVEYKLGCMFPIARLVNYAYPRRYAGGDEVTHLKGPQKLFNYVWSYCIDNFKASVNPKVVVTHAAGDIADEITSEPNQVVEVPSLNDIQFHYPPGMAAGVQNLVEASKSMVDLVRGSGEITGGNIPANISSGVFLETSIEIEQTRSRLKARNASSYLRRLGQVDLNMYLQFYTQPRVFRLTNKQGFPQHVEFYITQDEQGNRMASITDLSTGAPQATLMPIKGVPDVRVTVGSAMPFAKAIKADNAKQLYQMGAIDRETLFEMIDLPNKEEIAQRMNEKERQQAQAAQMQQK